MLRPKALGRRVAQRLLSGILKQFKEKTHQTKSITFGSACHCDLFSPFEAESGRNWQFQARSSKIRQFQAQSGNFRQNQPLFRRNQAESGKIRHNQAKSGRPLNLGDHCSGIPRCGILANTKCCPFWAEFFWVLSTKIEAQANHNLPASNGIILPKTWMATLS